MTGLSAASGTSFTVTVTGIDGTGTLRWIVGGNTILDAAGNAATAYASGGTVSVVDTPAAVTSITPSTARPTDATSLSYSVVFTKNVYDAAVNDFQLAATGTAAGAVTGVSAASGSSFTVTASSIAGDGTLRLDLLGGSSVQDIAGAGVPGYTSGSITTLDHTPPTVLSDTPSTSGPSTANSVTFSVVFSKPVYNVIPADFQVTATGSAVGTATSVSSANGTSLTVTAAGIDGSGTLRLDLNSGSTIEDDAGNTATGYTSGGTVTVVDTPATVTSITPSIVGPSNATGLNYSVVFSKNVYDVSAADFQLTTTGTAAGTVTSVFAASGSIYTRDRRLDHRRRHAEARSAGGSSVQDIAGAGVPATRPAAAATFRHTPPAVLSSTPSTPADQRHEPRLYRGLQRDRIQRRPGRLPSDHDWNSAGGTVASVSAASGTSFTVTSGSILGIGTLRLDLKAGTTIQDAAGNIAVAFTSGEHRQHLHPGDRRADHARAGQRRDNGGRRVAGHRIQPGRSRRRHGLQFQAPVGGADGLLGTADDTTITLSASYSGTTSTLSIPALAAGIYRLTVFDTITDTGGNEIDGNLDGQPGSNWVRDFVVVPLNTATFPATTTLSTGVYPTAVATGDFNGDGKLDLVAAIENSNIVSVVLGNGDGGSLASATYATGGFGTRCRGRG